MTKGVSKRTGSRNTEEISFGGYVIQKKEDGNLEATYSEKPNEVVPEEDPIKRIIKEINALRKKAIEDQEKALREIEKSKNLVHLGFIALVFVVIGLGYSYFAYISSDSAKYQSDLAKVQAEEGNQRSVVSKLEERIIQMENENKDLQKVNACLKGRKSWEMNLCFE